jgi:hypothetical protein
METRPSRLLPVFLASALCWGCTITIGGSASFDDDTPTASGGTSTGKAPPLPEPTVWRVAPPPLTPEQQQRKDQVDQFLAEEYRDYKIVEATQGYSGDIIYWADSYSIPGAYPDPPPPVWTQEDLTPPPGAELARTELELYPELRGPNGTTPIHRPDYTNYVMGLTSAGSLQDYIESYQVQGKPIGANRLYAGLVSELPNMGASGIVNQFEGDVEHGTFTLIEVTVACRGSNFPATLEQVGAVLSRDRRNFFDSKMRMHVEFITPTGKGWETRHFIPQPGRPYGPGAVVIGSTPGLATQREHRFDIWQDSMGNWWLAHNGNTLGHYPAHLFKTLNKAACTAAWYGEIYDETPTDWTWTDLGSGEFDSAGYGYAAYVRNPVFRDLVFTAWSPGEDLVTESTWMKPYDANCYTRTPLKSGSPPWDRFFYLGGPGGDAPGCD